MTFEAKVSFHKGSVKEESRVVAVFEHEGKKIVVAALTPFHPLDFQWPDQPADKGTLAANGQVFTVEDAVCVGVSPTGEMYVGSAIPVKKNDPDWGFCVGHVIDASAGIAEGDAVAFAVDEAYRLALSRTHSSTHVMALALDWELAALWRKEVERVDALGNPDFDQIAMDISHIGALECRDQYRMGKSLRKKGFSSDVLKTRLGEIEYAINERIASWLATGAEIQIECDGDDLMARRRWCTIVDGRKIAVSCGGTHARSFAEIGAAKASLSMPDDETLVIVTKVD